MLWEQKPGGPNWTGASATAFRGGSVKLRSEEQVGAARATCWESVRKREQPRRRLKRGMAWTARGAEERPVWPEHGDTRQPARGID